MNRRNIIVLICTVAVYFSHAMEPMEIDCGFELTGIPYDVCTIIAQYLVFDDVESEEEFIARTQYALVKPIPQWCYDYSLGGLMPCGICAAWCPNGITVAVLRLIYDVHNGQRITQAVLNIIDVNSKNVTMRESFGDYGFERIAVSRYGSMVAVISEQREADRSFSFTEEMREDIKNTLIIQNIATHKMQQCEVPDNFRMPHRIDCKQIVVAFNKQATHVIIYGFDVSKMSNPGDIENNRIQHHIIVPVTITMSNSFVPTKTLEKYCAQRGVCKNFVQQQREYHKK